MNITILTDARLTADPEAKTTKTGKNITTVRVADNPIKKGDRTKARFITVELWGTLATQATKLSKGDVVLFAGQLGIETWTDKEGNERCTDMLRNVSEMKIIKSESFWAKGPSTDDGDKAEDTEIPFGE